MTQTPGRARLALEAFDEFRVAHELRRNQFQRYVSISSEVRRQIHCAHTALSEQPLKVVFPVKNLTDVVFERCHATFD